MESPDVPRSTTRDGGLIAAGVFLVYALGACRTIYVGDSGELVAAAATLGIPHPSGYPLYVLLGKLWTLAVPIGSVAFRMSLFSAACAAAACGLLYQLLRRLGVAAAAALFAALTLAFSPSFWSQANVQRVYSLNALALVAATALLFAWHRSHRPAHLTAAALVTGLGACNHTFMGIFGLVAGVFAIATEPGLLKRPRQVAACVGAGLAGLLPYLYLPLRSRMDPRLDWGDPETFDNFVAVLTRRDFWNRAWMESPADWLAVIGDYLAGLGRELLWVGAALAVAGAVIGWKRRSPVLLPLLVMAANLWAMGIHGSRSDIFIWHRYYIPSYVMAAVLAAIAVDAAVVRWGRRAAVVLLIPAVLLVAGYRDFDRSRYRIAEDFSRTLLDSLPPGAHLSASDDNILFVLIYLHLVERLRPDVDLVMQGVGDAELGALRFDPDTDPLYFTHHPNWDFAALEIVPVGLVFRTVRAGSPWPEPVIPETTLAGEDDPRVPKDYLTSNLIGQFHYMLAITWEARDWPRAVDEFARATAAAPDNDVLFYNLGLIYQRNGLARRSLAAFERADEINPRHIPSGRPVRSADKVAELRKEVERLDAIERRLRDDGGLAGLTPGSAAYHLRMAELLAMRGEDLAARGHRLMALEAASSSEALTPLAPLSHPLPSPRERGEDAAGESSALMAPRGWAVAPLSRSGGSGWERGRG
jgi:tetratricopeptide (TPR) repeat protein